MKKIFLIVCVGMGCLIPTLFSQELAPAPAKIVRYATILIQRHDQNSDGILQREEWAKMSGTPQAIDLNGDGQITRDELIWYLNHYGQSRTIHRTFTRDLSEPYRFDPANLRFLRPFVQRASAPPISNNETNQELFGDAAEGILKANEQPIDDDVYQKLLEERQIPSARPYHVLPESLRGVPAWFILLDKNGDGQISLAEFAPTLAPRSVQLFKQLDKNNNGFIEPDEIRTPQTTSSP
jgi:hypothetical protein